MKTNTGSPGYEQGKAALDQLIDWYGEHASDLDRNEDTTRLHLVDRIIQEVLGGRSTRSSPRSVTMGQWWTTRWGARPFA